MTTEGHKPMGQTMNLIVTWCFLLFSLAVLSGCVDEIDLEGTGSGEDKMVIQGQLVKGCPSIVKVSVSRSSDFTSRELPPPVPGAVVFIQDDRGNQLSIPETAPGLYMLEIAEDSTAISLDIGASYRLTVTTSEGGQYDSSMETLSEVPQPDSISITLISRDELDPNGTQVTEEYVQFFIHTPLVTSNSSNRSFLRWTFQTIYQVTEILVPGPGPGPQTCYISRDLALDQVAVFNGNESNSDRLDGFKLVEDKTEPRFGLGYLLTVKQHSLSRSAYEYWNQVGQAVALSGGLFEATPGKIAGNMFNINDATEEVLGYFYVSEEQEITRFVKPSQAGSPKHFCDQSQHIAEPACTNCGLIPFASSNIPEGWEL